MKRNGLIFLVFLLSACTVHQENGNQWHYQKPPLLAGNQWRITQQSATPDGNRVCTVSAGEMRVMQSAHGKVQVATSSPINPGDYYRIIYGNHVHVAPNGQPWFGAQESQEIVAGLMNGGTVYTEIQQREVSVYGGREFERVGNKIDLTGFAPAYEKCRKFVNQTHPKAQQ